MITIEIPWEPTSWLAPKKGRFTFYDPREAEKRAARFIVSEQYKDPPLTGYTVIFLTFSFKIPDKTSKKKRAEMLSGLIIPTKKDCTNMQKLYEDCLRKIVIDDDRNVAKIFSEKLYAEKDNVLIKVYTLEEYVNNQR